MPSWNNTACCTGQGKMKPLFLCCNNSACSDCFTVDYGETAEIKLFDAPEGICINFQEYVWDKCCCNVTYFDVPCSTISMDHRDEAEDCCACDSEDWEPLIKLGPGTYHACVCDLEGNPVIPDTGEIIMQAIIQPGRLGRCC